MGGTVPGTILTPNQPRFLAVLTTRASNVTGNGANYDLICNSERYDRNGNYSTSTGVYTAPVTAEHTFGGIVALDQVGTGNILRINLITSNATYVPWYCDPAAMDSSGYIQLPWSHDADMDAGDTAFVRIRVDGTGANTVDVYEGTTGAPSTTFWGRLNG